MQAAKVIFVLLALVSTFSSAGCCGSFTSLGGGRQVWNGFSCGFWEARSAKKVPRLHSKRRSSLAEYPVQPIKKQQASIRPPHARFHSVPTDYAFATHKQYHPPQPIAKPNAIPQVFPFSSPGAIPPMYLAPDNSGNLEMIPKPLIKEALPTKDSVPPLPANTSPKPMQTDEIPPLPNK